MPLMHKEEPLTLREALEISKVFLDGSMMKAQQRYEVFSYDLVAGAD